MSLALTIILTCAAIAGAYALVDWDDPRPGLLDDIPWPRLPRLVRGARLRCRPGLRGLAAYLTAGPRLRLHYAALRLPRRPRKTPPRAHGGTGEPRTGPGEPHETGARRILTRIYDWVNPPTGQHSATVLRLGLDGLWHDAATGPFTVPEGYGVIGEGTVMTALDRMWGRP